MKDEIQGLGDITQDANVSPKVASLEKKITGLKNEIRQMSVEYGDLELYFREIKKSAQHLILPSSQKIYEPSKKKSKVKSPVIVVMQWSDWHYGAVQESEEIEDLAPFSPEILEDRIENKLCPRLLNWVELMRSVYTINELVIIDIGDNISGDIHPDLRRTNAWPTPVQAVKVGAFKGKMISSLAAHFEKVRVEFITADNHSRLTSKPQAKQQGMNTHNYVVGEFARLASSGQTNVEFNLYPMHSKVIDVNSRKYLCTHGHDTRGWAGIPWYGIDRKVSKEALARMWEPDSRKFHRVIMGHWHTPIATPWYWINGSASGSDALDHREGRRSEPVQCAWLVHPKRGEFSRMEFSLFE